MCIVACPTGCLAKSCCEQPVLRARISSLPAYFNSSEERCLVREQNNPSCKSRLAIITLIDSNKTLHPRFQPLHRLEFSNSSPVCMTRLMWRTLPCEIGNLSQIPRMKGESIQIYLKSKEKSTWWCVQRQFPLGLMHLVHVAPNAKWYMTSDDDTIVFPRSFGMLIRTLDARLGATEDLYTGHMMHRQIHRDEKLALGDFIATGGGALVRGITLRKLYNDGVLIRLSKSAQHGELRFVALDQALGYAMNEAGIRGRGHTAFQQFLGVGGCDPQKHVACHPFKSVMRGRSLKLKERGIRFHSWKLCEYGSMPSNWYVSSCGS